ncbi:MAG TPA: hypothetical protein VFU58_05605 [Candidatus Nitrosotalea sp.]|nr:hypothetical protein [Candidatus Nitrosotalea sp.]
MKNKIVPTILLLGITVILASSFYAFDSKFNAFAQTLDDSNQDPIPEDNYTDTNTGPIPEDNTTDPSMAATPIDNSTDMQSLSPSDNDTFPLDNMTMPEDNMPSASTPALPSNSTSILPPLEQVKSGVHANEVQCKQGFVLVIKAEDGSPACVYSQVAQILIQRGW